MIFILSLMLEESKVKIKMRTEVINTQKWNFFIRVIKNIIYKFL